MHLRLCYPRFAQVRVQLQYLTAAAAVTVAATVAVAAAVGRLASHRTRAVYSCTDAVQQAALLPVLYNVTAASVCVVIRTGAVWLLLQQLGRCTAVIKWFLSSISVLYLLEQL
jgi:hypothetical protein